MFKVGDRITGKEGSPYSYTNNNMIEGIVVRTLYNWTREEEDNYEGKYGYNYDEYDEADIIVLINKHTNEDCIGHWYPVLSEHFYKIYTKNKKEFEI